MTKRVVICGVDTSTLPRLTWKEAVALMEKVKSGDDNARSMFILCNMRLVLSVVQRYSHKVSNLDDLFQVGCVGLVKAVDNFNNLLGVKFSTYAVPMIIGEIRRYLRESSGIRVSRGVRDMAFVAMQTREQLELECNNDVSVDMIANRLNKPRHEILFALDAISEPVSLFEPIYNDSDDTVMMLDHISDKKNTDEKWLNNISLSQSILKLDQRERSILKKRYYEGKTQIEVANEVGISQAQVSRLEKNAVQNIKAGLSV